jgi:endonuclease/exonuclease/phosphatase family metal-dependent hydrolase
MFPSLRRALVCAASVCLLIGLAASPSTAATVKPSPATGLTATTGLSTAKVAWSKARNADHYRVCLRENENSSCVLLTDPITGTSATLTDLKPGPGHDYYMVVYSYNGSGRAASSPLPFDLKPRPAPAVATVTSHQVTTSRLLISWSAAAHATHYSVCLTTTSSATTCAKSSPLSSDTSAILTGLTPTPGADYYYQVRSYNGPLSSTTAKVRFDLPVHAVSSITATTTATGVISAQWPVTTNAETYELQLATNKTMTTGRHTYIVDRTHAGPSHLTIGTTYYYWVRGLNGVSKGAYSPIGHIRLPSLPVTINVLTYNLCGQDHCRNGAEKARIKPWHDRKSLAGSIARGTHADIIATQESGNDTDFGAELPGFGRAAYYSAKSLFYDKSRYSVLRSGKITLQHTGTRRYAVWAEFRDKATQNRFMVADPHLEPYKGKVLDTLREGQTKELLNGVQRANHDNLPVVYAGDYNSNKDNADQSKYPGGFDAALKVFTAAGIPDALVAAKAAGTATNWTYNSANQAVVDPYKNGDHVDHFYIDPKISVVSWKMYVKIKDAKYVTPFASDHNPIGAVLTIPGR